MTNTNKKTVYIKRTDLFKGLNLLLCNKIIEIDENFIGDNYSLFSVEPDDDDVMEEIERLSEINWATEKYNPYSIEDNMTSNEIKEYLTENYFEDIRIDLDRHDLEPCQYFLTNPDDYTIERLKEYGVELGYSELLELYVLPIYDYGTGWSAFSYSKQVDDDYQLGHLETLERTTVY